MFAKIIICKTYFLTVLIVARELSGQNFEVEFFLMRIHPGKNCQILKQIRITLTMLTLSELTDQ